MSILSIGAVLFDFDGVLMKSIEDHHRSWNQAFAEHGVTIGWEEFCLLEGQNLFTIARQLCAAHGLSESLGESIGARKNELYLKSATLALYPGVFPLLDFLHLRKKKCGLVTGALKDRFEKSVDTRLTSRFEVVITADDVTHTKPHPEPYLKSAARLGIAPSQCLVIENAPLGIESAKKAGMHCLAVTTTLGSEYLRKSDWIMEDLTAVLEWMHESIS